MQIFSDCFMGQEEKSHEINDWKSRRSLSCLEAKGGWGFGTEEVEDISHGNEKTVSESGRTDVGLTAKLSFKVDF